MGTPIGFNVLDPDGDLLAYCQQLQPAALTIIGNAALARNLKDALPECLVVLRMMPDDDVHTRIGAAAWVEQAFAAVGGDTRIYVQAGNEPQPESIFALRDWTLEAMAEADKRGLKLVVLNHAVGNPDYKLWATFYAPVLKAVQGGRHVIGAHEYILDGQEARPWLIGNVTHINAAADVLGCERPRILVNEFGCDRPGWKQMQARGITDEMYAAWLCQIWREVYAPAGVIGACIFSWGKGDRWQDYDVSDAGAFRDELSRLAPSLPPPAPLPEPQEPETPGEGEPETPIPPDVAARLAAAEAELAALHTLITRLTEAVNTLTETLHAVADVLSLVQTI